MKEVKRLQGNLAPQGAHLASERPSRRWLRGPARVFDTGEAALSEWNHGNIHPGDMLVLRVAPPNKSPQSKALRSLIGLLMKASGSAVVGLITDAIVTGAPAGVIIDGVKPTAADGGPLALVKDGDVLCVDLNSGRVDADTIDLLERSAERVAATKPVPPSAGQAAHNVPVTFELQLALPNGGSTVDVGLIGEMAQAAEGLGFTALWLFDHLLPPPSLQHHGEHLEPLVLLAYLAARTTSIRLGTSVLVLPMRNPFVVAKQVAALDIISNGRMVLGLGAGYSAAEFANVHAEFANRGRRLDEGIRLLRHLFSGTDQGFTGEFFAYSAGVFRPLPPQGSRLPIMIGGHSDAALKRAAHFADIWQSSGIGPQRYVERLHKLRELAGGREIVPSARIRLTGTLDERRRHLAEWREAGVLQLVVSAEGNVSSLQSIAEMAAADGLSVL